ncbi:aminotransferase class V domain protein, partial [Vibrio parahaemolyticus V-223/04]
AKVRAHLLETYNLEIGAGLGVLAGKAWRIGLMGYGARAENVALCLKALEESLTE